MSDAAWPKKREIRFRGTFAEDQCRIVSQSDADELFNELSEGSKALFGTSRAFNPRNVVSMMAQASSTEEDSFDVETVKYVIKDTMETLKRFLTWYGRPDRVISKAGPIQEFIRILPRLAAAMQYPVIERNYRSTKVPSREYDPFVNLPIEEPFLLGLLKLCSVLPNEEQSRGLSCVLSESAQTMGKRVALYFNYLIHEMEAFDSRQDGSSEKIVLKGLLKIKRYLKGFDEVYVFFERRMVEEAREFCVQMHRSFDELVTAVRTCEMNRVSLS